MKLIRFSYDTHYFWIFFLLLGLYFQSKYPVYLEFTALFLTALTIVCIRNISLPSRVSILFLSFAILVSFVMPSLFSKMPILSFSYSFYVLAGSAALLWMKKEYALALLWALVFYCVADTFFAFYQMLYLGNTRPDGLFMDSNARAIYVLISILFVFWNLSDVNLSNRVKPALLWVLLLVLMAGFHSAQSRAMLALGGLSLFFLWLYALLRSELHPKSVMGVTLASVVGFLIFYVIFQFIPNGGLAFLNKPDGPDVRFELWGTAWQLIKEHPFVGHGFGLFIYLYPSVRTETGTAGHFVHNDFLEHWLASGIPGLVLTLIPVSFFTYQFLKSFAKSQYQQVMFSGMGLCLMGYAFFNYFFWRMENLIVLAAVWKMVEQKQQGDRTFYIKSKHKLVIFLIFLLPAVAMIAKVDRRIVIESTKSDATKISNNWTDIVFGNESPLIPKRVRWNFIQAVNGNGSAIDFEEFAILVSQLNAEIDRGTLYPEFYCARAEMGYLLQESYMTAISYVELSERLNPSNIYCAFARFNINVAYKKSDIALQQVEQFLKKKVSIQEIDAVVSLNSYGLAFAKQQQSEYYVRFFGQYDEYLKNRKIELGL